MNRSREEMLALAERCEAATGPDRELDRAICLAIRNGRWISPDAVASYTASLDAAMTLVPEGYRLQLSEWDDEKHLRARGPWQAIFSKAGSSDQGFDPAFKTRCEHAATPALALCAAALRTLARENDDG